MDEFSGQIRNKILRNIAKTRLFRDDQKLDEAMGLANGVLSELQTLEGQDAARAHAEAYFERGMIFNALGEYEKTEQDMLQCGKYGRVAGDMSWELIGTFRTTLTQYLNELLSAQQAYEALLEIKRRQRDCAGSIPADSRGNFNNNVLNCAKRLSELAFEIDSPDFKVLAEDLLEFPEFAGMFSSRQEASWKYIVPNQARSRLAFVSGNTADAIKFLSGHLYVDEFGFESDIADENRPSFQRVAHGSMQEVARDYRDLGKFILSTDLSDKEKICAQIWKKGAELGDGLGNKRYIKQIRHLIEQLQGD